jgi:hypothetical protein
MKDRFNWWLSLGGALGAFVVFVAVAIQTSEPFLYVFVVIPAVSMVLGILLVVVAIAKKPRRCLSIVSMLVTFWINSVVLVANYSTVRTTSRWLLWSRAYKSEVLAQPESANGELRHIEWDGWGFPGAGDTRVYLVFDPTDSLAVAAQNNQLRKFKGIPCKVPLVSRLESRWYAVRFYTDESWGERNRDCSPPESD